MANNLTATEVLARQRAVNPYLETIRQQIISSAGAGLLGTDRVANIPTQSESAKPLFRIGGGYRTRNGVLVMLSDVGVSTQSRLTEGRAYVNYIDKSGHVTDGGGVALLADGRNLYCGNGMSLIPGELTLRDGEWVALDDPAAPTPTAPYGIPGQPASTAQAEVWTPSLVAAVNAYRANHARLAQAKPLNTTELEKARPALDWNKPASTDRFPGFVVDKFDINTPSDPWAGNNHPLQRIAAERSPLHGSAWLVID